MEFSLFLYFYLASRTLDTAALHSDEAKSTKGKKKAMFQNGSLITGRRTLAYSVPLHFPFRLFYSQPMFSRPFIFQIFCIRWHKHSSSALRRSLG